MRVGNRRRNTKAIAMGGVLVLFCSGVVGVAIWANAIQFNWNTIKPTWLLLAEMNADSQQRADAALAELTTRFDNDEISWAHAHQMAEWLLAAHGNDAMTWTDVRSDALQGMVMRGALKDDQIVRYAEQVIETNLLIRPRVRQGHSVLVSINIDRNRPAEDCPLDLQVYGTSFAIDSQEMLRGRGGGTSSLCTLGGQFGAHVIVDLPPGMYPVQAAWELTLLDRVEGKEYAQWIVRFEDQLEVVEADGDEIAHRSDEALDRQMAQLIRVRQATVPASEGGLFSGMVDFRPLPIDVAFDVFWKIGDRELQIGAVHASAGQNNISKWYNGVLDLDLDDAEHITVILRASSEVARAHTVMDEIWGGELVFEDQPLLHQGQVPAMDLEQSRWWSREIEP